MRTADAAGRLELVTARAAVDVELFARVGLPHHLRLPFAPFHRRLFSWHRRLGVRPLPHRGGLRFCLAAPRGSAKSTVVSLLLPLHDIVFARERYVLLISATQRQAQMRLRALRRELTEDTPLARWFAPRFGRANVESTERVLVAGGVRVEAFGAGAEMRGVSNESWRPTKIILDDAESSASAESTRRRERLLDWFREVVEHLGHGYTHMLAIGTVLHPQGLLATLLGRPDFESMRCKSIEEFASPSPLWDEWRRILTDLSVADRREAARNHFLRHRAEMENGARVLWPHHEDYERLMAQLTIQGRRAFYQEKQNEPLGPEDALFEPDAAWRARRVAAGIEVWSPRVAGSSRLYGTASLRLFGYHDAALGRGRGDFAALATVGLAPDGTLIVLSVWARRAPPSQQVAVIFDTHDAAPFERLALEGTGFQELLLLPIDEERTRRRAIGRRSDLPVEVVRPTRRKESRIAALEPLLSCGRLALMEDLPEEFWLELTNHPRTEHDDALDAAAGAVELAMGAGDSAARARAETIPSRQSGGRMGW